MKTNLEIEYSIMDAIIERTVEFKIGNKSFNLYPPSLGVVQILQRLYRELNINDELVNINPYLEAARLAKEKPEVSCRILAYSVFKDKENILNESKIVDLAKFFESNLAVEDIASLLLHILKNDETEEYVKYLGLDKEQREKKRIYALKHNVGITFGGISTYGSLIDFACQRYGWTMEYVTWGVSFVNLKMLMADSITTIYLSEDERKKLNIFDSSEIINADDPKNKELMRKILSE